MQVWAYYEGVNRDNVRAFVAGNHAEPAAHVVIEETDNPATKVLIREEARKQRVRLVMATDLGSAVQVDIRPFDTDPGPGQVIDTAGEWVRTLDSTRTRLQVRFLQSDKTALAQPKRPHSLGHCAFDPRPSQHLRNRYLAIS